MITVGDLLNKRQDSSRSVPAMLRSFSLYKSLDLHTMLLGGGYAELHRSFRKADFESEPEVISFELADRLN